MVTAAMIMHRNTVIDWIAFWTFSTNQKKSLKSASFWRATNEGKNLIPRD
jgi:hypothetical protein